VICLGKTPPPCAGPIHNGLCCQHAKVAMDVADTMTGEGMHGMVRMVADHIANCVRCLTELDAHSPSETG
jgi:hypothetical protein